MSLTFLFQQAKVSSRQLATMADIERNAILREVADSIECHADELLAANAKDLSSMDCRNPLYDRLMLTRDRLVAIAADMRHVAGLPSPLGRTSHERTLGNGLRLHRVSVPFGVIGVVYEARPNVTFDVFSLCFKSGNACVLKGGHDAAVTNRAAIDLIHQVMERHGVDIHAAVLLPATHEATSEMLSAVGYIDLCIPRGGCRLIDFVRDTARVPVIETGAGVVNTYFDKAGDLRKGRAIVLNAKTRRVSVCNALDCLVVHERRLPDLPVLVEPLAGKQVVLYADPEAYAQLEGHYPAGLLCEATPESYGTEYMDYKLTVCAVPSIEAAIGHIARYGSGHSESIITEDEAAARLFQTQVDAACVYWNAPTSFTDGAQFGLGAEIGISTQKLGPRGPMGLEEMCTYKWIVEGDGQTRP